jgi:hypothetical protein
VALRHLGFIDLPAHAKAGGFDHAAVHEPTGRVYVAHPANDAVDVIDVQRQRCVGSIPGLAGVAGALVAEPERSRLAQRRLCVPAREPPRRRLRGRRVTGGQTNSRR